MKKLLRLALLAGLAITGSALLAAERIPPAPPRYFNDYAGVVSPATADRLNGQLEQYERASSNQLLVVLYPKMESDSSVEEYTVRVAQAWRAGQKGRDNGAVLFAFMQEHKLYIQVGYGLEPRLTDALCQRIISEEIVPRFRAGDVDGGMTAAVAALIAASQGEYRGSGRTHAEATSTGLDSPAIIIAAIMIFGLIMVVLRGRRSVVYGNPLRRSGRGPFVIMNNPNSSGWFGGGGGGGGGGGFSGGGGSFGGGGAGGSW